MRKRASTVMTNPSGFRTLMEENIFISKDPMNRVRMLVDVLPLSVAADKVRDMSDFHSSIADELSPYQHQ